MECGYVFCFIFLFGDRYVVIGIKGGELMFYDVVVFSLLKIYKVYVGFVWSVSVWFDGRGLVSGSVDKDVKFWDFEMREEGEGEKVVSCLGVEIVVSKFLCNDLIFEWYWCSIRLSNLFLFMFVFLRWLMIFFVLSIFLMVVFLLLFFLILL